ncbi:hypothetical protein ACHQM5_018174 [Ranunculus cassubicifolius]
MSGGRNRSHSNQLKGPQIHHDPPFNHYRHQIPPHPSLIEEFQLREREFHHHRGGGGGGGPPPPLPPPPHHPSLFLEERLTIQHQEIQGLLADNQGLAATHVALKQELEATQNELQRMGHIAGTLHVEKDGQLREMHEKAMKLEAELHGVEGMKVELGKVRSDVVQLRAARQELSVQVQSITQDLSRATADLNQVPQLKTEIEAMRQELDRARAAIEYERKAHAERYEQGHLIEKNLVLIAREVEKLRAEVANGEMRVRAAAAPVGNPGYSGNYNNPDPGYAANPYSSGYGMNPVQSGGAEAAQYGPGPGAWGGYDTQRAAGHR